MLIEPTRAIQHAARPRNFHLKFGLKSSSALQPPSVVNLCAANITRSDKQRFDSRILQPFLYGYRDKLRTIIAADILRCDPNRDQIPQHFHHVRALDALIHIDRQAFAGKLIRDYQQLHQSAVFQPLGKKIIRPDMVIVLRSLPVAGIFTSAYMKLFPLLFTDFQTFLAPQTIDSLEVDSPPLFPQEYGDPMIAISWMLHMQYQYIVNDRFILLRLFASISLRTRSLPQSSVGLSLGYPQQAIDLIYYLSSPCWD